MQWKHFVHRSDVNGVQSENVRSVFMNVEVYVFHFDTLALG